MGTGAAGEPKGHKNKVSYGEKRSKLIVYKSN